MRFYRQFTLTSEPAQSVLHFSADTRYKLIVNGTFVTIGPARSSPLIWYYDSIDIAPYLKEGLNDICFVVVRYFLASRAALPFQRTPFPGLTVVGNACTGTDIVQLKSHEGWQAEVDEAITLPMGLPDDVFLHVRPQIY